LFLHDGFVHRGTVVIVSNGGDGNMRGDHGAIADGYSAKAPDVHKGIDLHIVTEADAMSAHERDRMSEKDSLARNDLSCASSSD